MSTTNLSRLTAAFKKKVCLEALKERETIKVLAKKFDIHPNQINSSKREFIKKSESVFEKDSDHGSESKVKIIETLYSRIGEWSVSNDFLKKKLL